MSRKSNVFPAWYNGLVDSKPVSPPVKTRRSDELLKVIYAPDPQTGFPNSHLSILMGQQTDSEIKQFIQNTFQLDSPVHRQDVHNVDDNTLFEGIERRRESAENYVKRMQEYARKTRENLAKKREEDEIQREFSRIKSDFFRRKREEQE